MCGKNSNHNYKINNKIQIRGDKLKDIISYEILIFSGHF